MLSSSNIKLFAIIALIFIATFESGKAQYLECNIPVPIACGPWTSQTRTVTLPTYPTCPITVNFSYRICVNYRQVVLNDIQITGNCTDLIQDVFPSGYIGVDETVTKKLWKDIYKQLAENLFLEIYNATAPQYKYQLECPYGDSGVEFQLIDGACTVVCTQVYLGNTAPQNLHTIKYLKCRESCCMYIQRFCYNTQTNQVEKYGIGPFEYGTSENLPACNTVQLPQGQCTGAYFNYLGQHCNNDCDKWEN